MKLFSIFLMPIIATAQTAGPIIPIIYRVSQFIPASHATSGCNWKTGLKTGGGACFDESSYIQPLLDTCVAATPCDVIFDVSTGWSVSAELPQNAVATLEGIGDWNTGIFTIGGSNATSLCTKWPGFPTNCTGGVSSGGTPPAQSGAVTIKNLGINSDRAGEGGACSPVCMNTTLTGLNSITLDHVYFYDPPFFGLYAGNFGTLNMHDVRAESQTLSPNTDCFHFFGPHGAVNADGIWCQGGDDGIADNIPEGYGGNGGPDNFTNMYFAGAIDALRTYCSITGSPSYSMLPITMTNITGFFSNPSGLATTALARLGGTPQGGAECIQSVKISNVDVQMIHTSGLADGSLLNILDNVGDLALSNVRWNAPISAQPWLNFSVTSTNLGTITCAACTVSNYTCTSCVIYRSTTGSGAAFWGQIPTGNTIKRHECNGCAIVNETGQSYSAVAYGWDVQSGGAIGSIVANGFSTELMTSFLNGNQWSRITVLTGSDADKFPTKTANLPACSTSGVAYRMAVSDATLPTIGVALTGGGAVFATVHCSITTGTYFVDGL